MTFKEIYYANVSRKPDPELRHLFLGDKEKLQVRVLGRSPRASVYISPRLFSSNTQQTRTESELEASESCFLKFKIVESVLCINKTFICETNNKSVNFWKSLENIFQDFFF